MQNELTPPIRYHDGSICDGNGEWFLHFQTRGTMADPDDSDEDIINDAGKYIETAVNEFETLRAKVARYEAALQSLVNKCGAGHVCCGYTSQTAQAALGETK